MRNLLLWGTVALLCACGGVITAKTDGGADGGVLTGGQGEPPGPPLGGTTPSSNVETFAIQTIFLGETDRSGNNPSTSAWRSFGYNLDGLVTTKDSTDVCTLAPGSFNLTQVDGDYGIDNAWGTALLPIIQSAMSLPLPSQAMNQAIQSGEETVEVSVTGLSDDPAQSSTGLRAQVFIGGVYPGTPMFDDSTDWPVLASSLADGQTIAGGARIVYDAAYVTHGTFVSGATMGTLPLSLVLQGMPFLLVIHHPIITFDHGSATEARDGTIAGVLDPNEFNAMLKAVAGRISVSLCGSAFDDITQLIMQAQEILPDGTNSKSKPCSAISIGLGFTAVRIANPTQVQADPTPPPNPCAN